MVRLLTALLREPDQWELVCSPWYVRAAYTVRDVAVLALFMACTMAAVVILGSL